MQQVAWIALGGAVGTGARYAVSVWAVHQWGPGYPFGTLAVNLVGSFLLGLLVGVAQSSEWIGPTALLALSVGVLGGFTTYSTFSLDAVRLIQAGTWASAAGYLATTVLGGLALTALGLAAGGWLTRG